MGIYLGQLPPAELARLKAEVAETLVANFCYPRFFDYRTDSLRMRPVDRAKRQDVWLYLSSVDFTAWGRVDLMSPDFQRYIERLLIQFVQRNRSFFGEQGRKRMSDIRMLISSSAASVVQGLRAHITGQRQEGSPPFGSPRPVVSWSALTITGKPEPSWEQIAASTMQLQQQLQELRGEIRPTVTSEARPSNGAGRRGTRSQSSGTTAGRLEQDGVVAQPSSAVANKPVPQVPSLPNKPAVNKPAAQVNPPVTSAVTPVAESKTSAPLRPATVRVSPPAGAVASATPVASPRETTRPGDIHRPAGAGASATSVAAPSIAPVAASAPPTGAASALPAPVAVPAPVRKAEPVIPKEPPVVLTPVAPAPPPERTVVPASSPMAPPPVQSRSVPQTATVESETAPAVVTGQQENLLTRVGEDDIAIFEQLRHQLVIWLRVEAVHAGLETVDQSPLQLLELLSQQAQVDETRLQVVSTLLNLSNQVTKNKQVSTLDYKQALMLHLMHTRR